MTDKPRIAIYIRVSTTTQAESGMSLPAQLQKCAEYCQYQGIAPPYCLYMDEGISGGTVEKRPAMTQMLADMEAGHITHIVSAKLDRLWRKTKDALTGLETIKKAGGHLAILDLPVDLGTIFGEALFTMSGMFATMERQTIGERILSVRRFIVANEGRWMGPNPPYGYRYDKTEKRLEINEDEAQVVRRIFAAYLEQDGGVMRICRQLNNEGIPTQQGREWRENGIRRMLHNPTYAGIVLFGVNRTKLKGDSWYHKAEDDPRWIRTPGAFEPIIDRETWEAVQHLLKSRFGSGRHPTNRRLLSGVLWCGHCGQRMYTATRKYAQGEPQTRIYRCGSHVKRGAASCPQGGSIKEEVIDRLVLQLLRENLDRIKGQRSRRNRPAPKDPVRKTREWRIHQVEEKQRRLTEVYLEGELSGVEYRQRKAKLDAERTRIEQETEPAPLEIEVSELEVMFAVIQSEEIEPEERRKRIKALIERVEVHAGEVAVRFVPLAVAGWELSGRVARPQIVQRKV